MNVRVRSPGSSASDTAAAAVRRVSRSASSRRLRRDVERHLAAVELDAQRRDELSEQPSPGALARDRLLREDLLLGLSQQVGAVTAGSAQVVAAEVEAVGGEQGVGALVVERRPLELEEQKLGFDLGRPLLHRLEQRTPLGIRGVGGEPERGVGGGTPDELVDRLELAHRGLELRRVELGNLAGIAFRGRVRALAGLFEQPLDAGAALAFD